MADGEDITLDSILDPILRGKVRGLIPSMGESFTTREIKDAILSCRGDVNDATDLLFGDAPKEIQDAVEVLEQKLPLKRRDQIMKILIKCRGNRELAEISLSKQVTIEDDHDDEPKEHSSTTTTTLNSQMDHRASERTEMNQTTSIKTEFAKGNTNSKRSDVAAAVSETHSVIEIKDEGEDHEPKTSAIPIPSDLTSLSSNDIPLPSGWIHTTPAKSGATVAESSRSGIKFLQEIFSLATEEMCDDALRRCRGNIEAACEILEKKDGFGNLDNDDDDSKTAKNCSPATKQSFTNPHNAESSNCAQKRKARSVDNLSNKRIKSDNEDEEEGSEDEESEESFSLEPASEWVRKYFPGGRRATILLGPREELRDTIPRRVLYENSSFFSDFYDTAEAEEWDDDTVKLPDVDPLMFDLVIQFLVAKTFTLEPDANRSATTEITIILNLVFLAERLGFPDPSGPVIENLRGILVEDRRALRRGHIKRAFELEDEHGIQRLFVQAVVRDYMKTRGTKLNSNEIDTDGTDDDDDEEVVHRDGAHRAFHNKDKFWFHKEIKYIRAFKYQLLEEQDSILKSGKKVVTRQATRKQREIHTIKYVDPLDGEWFYL